MKPSQILRSKQWCQGKTARDKDGNPVDVKSQELVSCCMLGAISLAYSHDVTQLYRVCDQLKALLKTDYAHLASWNDEVGRTKEDVISALEAVGE